MWGQEDQWHLAQPRENHLGDCFFSNSGQWQKKTETKFSSAPEVTNLFSKKYFAKIEISKFEETHEMLRLCGRGGHTD